MIASLCLSLAPSVAGPTLAQDAAAPAPVAAGALSYTYGQFDFIRGDGDGFNDGPNGWALHGSYALQDKLFLFGGLGHQTGEVSNANKDVNSLSIGIGYHSPIDPGTDLVFGASLAHANSESGTPNSSIDGTGYTLQGGVRHAIGDKWELDGTVGYTDFSSSSSNTWLEVGGVYRMTPNLGLCGALMVSDNIDTFSLGIRYQP
jgi:long-subunit fatty acid transport protein